MGALGHITDDPAYGEQAPWQRKSRDCPTDNTHIRSLPILPKRKELVWFDATSILVGSKQQDPDYPAASTNTHDLMAQAADCTPRPSCLPIDAGVGVLMRFLM